MNQTKNINYINRKCKQNGDPGNLVKITKHRE